VDKARALHAGGYYNAAQLPLQDWLTEDEREWIMGKTLLSLFPDSFGQA
jgi:hypothetical protein